MRFLIRYGRRWLASVLVATAGFLLASCSTTQRTPAAPPQPYTRISHPDTNTVQLQIAVRKFLPAHHRGPVIWLVGASHIGDPDYYHALQKHLDAQTLVLFEGVNAGAHKRHVREPAVPDAADSGEPAAVASHPGDPAGVQATLAQSLGLVFQLDAIDYDRTNFLNSDLSIQDIRRLVSGKEQTAPSAPDPAEPLAESGPPAGPATTNSAFNGPPTSNASFNYLMQAMDGSSFLGSMMKLVSQFLGSSPSLRATTKFAFIESLGELKGDLTQMRGLPPDMQQLLKVLIEARNQAVIDDLKTETKRVPRSGSIAVFYGTGHMEDMEKQLTRELRYHPAGDIWFTAFSVDVRQTGMSATQLQMMSNLIKWQMDQLQP